jgi:hypothetical protein
VSLDEEGVKSHVMQFISEFEQTDKSATAMFDLLPIWKDTLLLDSRALSGARSKLMLHFIKLCEDYATGLGDLDLVKIKIKEIRLMFSV